MSLYNQDFTVPANTDYNIRFNVISEATGLPIPVADIEGASWAITPFEDEVTPLISKDLVSGGILTPEDGVVIVLLLATDTADLSGEFSHELRLRDSEGVRSACRGRMTIKYQIANNPL